MPINTPESEQEVIERAVADVELALAAFGVKPSLPNTWFNALIVAYANRVFDFYFALDQAVKEALPDTAVDFLERWAAIFGIIRAQGTKSTGNVVVDGTVSSIIPINTFLATGEGKRYKSTATVAIESKSISVSSITRAGTTATLTTAVPHELGTQVSISVVGATQPEYNITDSLAYTITANDEIQYEVTGSPATPATGTITLEFISATVVVESEEVGTDEDQAFDVALQFESPIAGVDNTGRVDFDGLGGGSDQESITDLRSRLLDRIQNPIAHFNVSEITAVAKSVPGVTRVFVQEITPGVGQVTIYFTRDNDDDGPIPSGAEIAAVDAVIQAIRPANTDSGDVFVLAPTAVPINFTFTALNPNTSTMQAAITASLEQFFAERTELGQNVTQDAYRSAIFNTVDTVTGERVVSFTLSTPSADVTINAGELGTLGNITYS